MSTVKRKLTPVPFTSVRFDDVFWAPRMETNRKVTLQHISGVSLDGAHFLYENPLSSAGDRHHVEWFLCPCCPSNVARNIASIGKYFYSTGPRDVWVHLFAGNTVELEVDGKPVSLRQSTMYPWDGAVALDINPKEAQTFTLQLRVPGWCKSFRLAVNGEALDLQPDRGGYLAIAREWRPGDKVAYTMDMPLQATWANPAVRQLEGRVAMQRGPVIYCLESVDNGEMILDRIAVDPEQITSEFTVEYRPDLLGGVSVIHGTGTIIAESGWGDTLYRSEPPEEKEIALTAVPYCVWDNREPGEMRVWIRTKK